MANKAKTLMAKGLVKNMFFIMLLAFCFALNVGAQELPKDDINAKAYKTFTYNSKQSKEYNEDAQRQVEAYNAYIKTLSEAGIKKGTGEFPSLVNSDSAKAKRAKKQILDTAGEENYKKVEAAAKELNKADKAMDAHKLTVDQAIEVTKASLGSQPMTNLLFDTMGRGMANLHSKQLGLADPFSNARCRIDQMKIKYQSSCYSCIIVKTLIETFMSACSKVYGVATKAGGIILLLGTVLWLAVFALHNVSSFANVEPASEINELLVFLFKVVFVWAVLGAGLDFIIQYMINPILATGADYGIGIIQSAGVVKFNPETAGEIYGEKVQYAYEGVRVIEPAVINKLLNLNRAIDATVSTNLVVGHALTCHSLHAGMIRLSAVNIPDIWIWLCGAIIWFFGFMMTLAVSYYLLDVCFKMGFMVMVLPVVIALWPFNYTKDKLKVCFSILLKSAAVFAFLAITTSYALTIIQASIGGIDELLKRIVDGDAEYVADKFAPNGSQFLILVFAYLYAMKLIMGTINDFSEQFFPDKAIGNVSPIHKMTTQMTDGVKKKGMEGADAATSGLRSYAGDKMNQARGSAYGAIAKGAKATGGAIGNAAAGAVKFAANKFKKKG